MTRRVAIAIDGSQHSRDAFNYYIHHVSRAGDVVGVIHCFEPFPYQAPTDTVTPELYNQLEAAMKKEGAKLLAIHSNILKKKSVCFSFFPFFLFPFSSFLLFPFSFLLSSPPFPLHFSPVSLLLLFSRSNMKPYFLKDLPKISSLKQLRNSKQVSWFSDLGDWDLCKGPWWEVSVITQFTMRRSLSWFSRNSITSLLLTTLPMHQKLFERKKHFCKWQSNKIQFKKRNLIPS